MMMPPINSPNTAGWPIRSNNSPPSLATSNITARPTRIIGWSPGPPDPGDAASAAAPTEGAINKTEAAASAAIEGFFIICCEAAAIITYPRQRLFYVWSVCFPVFPPL
jgi:hypothetical protein